MATRIASKSRPIKRGPTADYNTTDGTITNVVGRLPKLDVKNFADTNGLTTPVSVRGTDVTPEGVAATPNQSWAKGQILTWLAGRGVVIGDPAVSSLNKSELLDLVADVLSQ